MGKSTVLDWLSRLVLLVSGGVLTEIIRCLWNSFAARKEAEKEAKKEDDKTLRLIVVQLNEIFDLQCQKNRSIKLSYDFKAACARINDLACVLSSKMRAYAERIANYTKEPYSNDSNAMEKVRELREEAQKLLGESGKTSEDKKT